MRTAVVSGASSGIGAACAEAFAARGWRLVLLARREDRLAAIASACRERGASVTTHVLDVRDRAAVEAWAVAEAGALADVDILLNNAGLARGLSTVQEGSQDDWDEMIDTNVRGLLAMSRAVVPHMVARGRGDVLSIGSVAGRWTYPKGAVYCATKAAERVISEGLRMDLLGTGVRVATIDPGMVETEFSLVRFHGDVPRAKAVYEGLTPLTATDIADAACWILERPAHVNIAEMVLFPTDQASPTLVNRRRSSP